MTCCNINVTGGWCLVVAEWGRQRRGRQMDGNEEVLRALPYTHGQTSTEEHVEKVLHLVCDLKAKAFTDHHVPRAAKFLVHGLFDHLGCTLAGSKNSLEILFFYLFYLFKVTLTSLLVANFSQAVTHNSMVSTLISSGISVCWEHTHTHNIFLSCIFHCCYVKNAEKSVYPLKLVLQYFITPFVIFVIAGTV